MILVIILVGMGIIMILIVVVRLWIEVMFRLVDCSVVLSWWFFISLIDLLNGRYFILVRLL